jgi:hypothetical protein
MKTFATAVIALIVVIQVVLIGYSRASGEADTRPIPPITPETEPLFPLAFEGIYQFATEQARTWRNDAVLVQSNLQVDWPREVQDDPLPLGQLPRGGWIMFAFVSEDDYLTIRMDRGSGTIVETRVVTLDSDSRARYLANPLDYSQAAVASLTAMTTIETNWGNAWRNQCLDRRYISWATVLTDPATGDRFWRIEYEEQDGGIGSNMSFDVSWESGEVVNMTNEMRPCSEIVDES